MSETQHKSIGEHRLKQVKLWMLAVVFYTIGTVSLIVGGLPG